MRISRRAAAVVAAVITGLATLGAAGGPDGEARREQVTGAAMSRTVVRGGDEIGAEPQHLHPVSCPRG